MRIQNITPRVTRRRIDTTMLEEPKMTTETTKDENETDVGGRVDPLVMSGEIVEVKREQWFRFPAGLTLDNVVTVTTDQGQMLILMRVEEFRTGSGGGIRTVPVLKDELPVWDGI